MVVETAALSEVERGEYCRERGIYPEHLQAWRRACEQANGGVSPRTHGERSADHPERWSGDLRNWQPITEVWLNPSAEVTEPSTAGSQRQ